MSALLSFVKYFVKTIRCVNQLISRNFWGKKFKCGNYRNSLSCLFDKNFVKATVLLKEVSKELIWRNIFSVREDFSFFHTVRLPFPHYDDLLKDFLPHVCCIDQTPSFKFQHFQTWSTIIINSMTLIIVMLPFFEFPTNGNWHLGKYFPFQFHMQIVTGKNETKNK